MTQERGISCFIRKREEINTDIIGEDISYAKYVKVVSKFSPLAIEEQICHWDFATLVSPEFTVEYAPEQYPLISITRLGIQLVLNVAGQGIFSTTNIDEATSFSAELLSQLTVKGYEPEYELQLLAPS